MKILLIDDGNYCGMENINFPIEVDAVKSKVESWGESWYTYTIKSSDLIRHGAIGFTVLHEYTFLSGSVREIK